MSGIAAPKRTKRQTVANDFDRILFNLLIYRAEIFATDDPAWKPIAEKLRAVRPEVRAMMHPDDVRKT